MKTTTHNRSSERNRSSIRKKLILSGVHLELTEALKKTVEDKVEKLFNHDKEIQRLKIHLEYQAHNSTHHNQFIAKGHIEIKGNSLVVAEASDDLYISIEQLIIKLDRKLRQRSRLRKVKRKQLHAVDIPAEFPKPNQIRAKVKTARKV